MYKQRGSADVSGLVGLVFIVWFIGAWLTHVVVCLAGAKWGFLIAGAIMFPIGIIHGTGIWLGFF